MTDDGAVTTLIDRIATGVRVDNPKWVTGLLSELHGAGRLEACAVLADRAARHTRLTMGFDLSDLLHMFRDTGAEQPMTVLAHRAASQMPISDPLDVGVVLAALHGLGMVEAANELLARDPAAHVEADGHTERLLEALRACDAHEAEKKLRARISNTSSPVRGIEDLRNATDDEAFVLVLTLSRHFRHGCEPGGTPTPLWHWEDLSEPEDRAPSPPPRNGHLAPFPDNGCCPPASTTSTQVSPFLAPAGGAGQNAAVMSTGDLAELEARMAELSTPTRVYVAAARFTEVEPDLPELAARIRALLAEAAADEAWQRFIPGYAPPSVPQICAALEPLETHEAAAFLAGVAAVDLVWPDHRHMPAEAAERVADRVVSLLGPEGSWWTNHDAGCGAVNGLTPLFDSLVAGSDGEHFALALQIADD
ncbi:MULTISPECIES: hypothetical protein [unclassified Streptomyces]|uniref:hypothetical protein n=1 Tax=unclassified Streptomyces TaxID=2593676 RepID=UPI002E25C528|nr:hypothetical protein OG296_41235 [Streptomyces sp. NBC_01001]